MFVADSSYLIGLFLKNDKHNKRAREIYEQIKYEKLLINSTIITEVMNSFKKKNYEIGPNKAFNSMKNINHMDILTITGLEESLRIFNYYNHSINFSDCTILKTMYAYKINTIISFDDDFDKINGIRRIH